MSWYRDNRWLGNFVIAFAGSALLALWFLFHVRSGFAEFRTTLPTTAAAPLLGQELAQVELLFGILIDARVDAIAAVKRTTPPAGATAAPTPPKKPSGLANAPPAVVERTIVDLTFTA